MDTIRWGILGCGKIANKFASDLRLVKNATLVAAASQNSEKGDAFRKEFNVPVIYNTYTELVSAADVDVIYIATPHGLHFEHALMCLDHGKAVLCEKALALNTKQVCAMIARANEKKTFLMEAFWTKFLPQFEAVMGIIAGGQLGQIKMLQADFGFAAPEPLAQRLYDPLLGGGALLDIGIYPVFLALAVLGKPTHIHAMINPYPSGVDEQCVITMNFANTALAVLSSTFAADTPVEAMIAGTKGRVHMRNRFHNATGSVEVVVGKESAHPIEVQREEGFGYQFEARHVGDCLRQGLIESPVMTHSNSIALMETLDEIRKICGIRYAVD
jgi:predicted dehydrogenase